MTPNYCPCGNWSGPYSEFCEGCQDWRQPIRSAREERHDLIGEWAIAILLAFAVIWFAGRGLLVWLLG